MIRKFYLLSLLCLLTFLPTVSVLALELSHEIFPSFLQTTGGDAASGEALPEPKAEGGESVIDIEADWMKADDENKITEASGQVIARYKGSTVKAEQMRVDQKRYIVFVQGPFFLEEKDTEGRLQKVQGEDLQYNFKTKIAFMKKGYIVQDAEGPEQHLYIESAEVMTKNQNRRRILLKGAEITSCNFVEKKQEPHYRITAMAGLVIPKDKIILRNMTLYYGRVPLFWSPLWFISLKKRQYLAITNNLTEGWGLKTALAYSMKGSDLEDLYRDFQDLFNENMEDTKDTSHQKLYPDDYGVIYNDFMEKKGWGKGIEHTHEFDRETVVTGGYYQLHEQDTGLDDYSFKLDLKQKVTDQLRYTARWEDRNIYNLAGFRDDFRLTNSTVTYIAPTTFLSLLLNYNGRRGLFPSSLINNALHFTQRFSPKWQLSSSVQYLSSEFLTHFDQFMTHETTLSYYENGGTVTLLNRQFVDLTSNAATRFPNRFYTDISPELSVQYALAKLLDQPLLLKATAGRYFEKTVSPSLVVDAMRYTTSISLINRPIYPLGGNAFSIDLGGTNYTQYFYGTGDQQYVIHEQIGSYWKIGSMATLASTYIQDHLNAQNNRPFRNMDFLTGQHLLTESLRVADQKTYDWTTSTGFNYVTNAYLPLTSVINYVPSPRERYTLSFGYDLNAQVYHPLVLQANLQSRAGNIQNIMGIDEMAPHWSASHYLVYNLNLGRLESMTNAITYDYGHRWEDHWVLSLAGSYSFFTQKYDFTQIALVKDLHDIMISFSYSPLGQSYLLTISSVAYPATQGELSLTQGRYAVGLPGQRFQF